MTAKSEATATAEATAAGRKAPRYEGYGKAGRGKPRPHDSNEKFYFLGGDFGIGKPSSAITFFRSAQTSALAGGFRNK